MDFSVDVKQQELIDLAKTIAEKEIAPRALRIDKSGVMDGELLKVMKESGMTQLSVPKEYGGAGYKGECHYVDKPAVRDGNIVTANGFSALEFTREILYALGADTPKKIEKSYRMNKTGVWEAPEIE